MKQRLKFNQGFSFIELILAIALLSIVMIMISGFMSSTSAQFGKTKKNINVQSSAQTTYNQMCDTIMQAEYIRVCPKTSTGTRASYSFVPDNYANYIKPETEARRDVILDLSTYKIVNKMGTPYPNDALTTDRETIGTVYSFRMFKQGGIYNELPVDYIYLEYMAPNKTGNVRNTETGGEWADDVKTYVIYYFKHNKIYMYRTADDPDGTPSPYNSYDECLAKVEALVAEEEEAAEAKYAHLSADEAIRRYKGRELATHVEDFKLSADAVGEALVLIMDFDDSGYKFDLNTTVRFRNTNVLTAKPQLTKKLKNPGEPAEDEEEEDEE